jgi:hypothetical protein
VQSLAKICITNEAWQNSVSLYREKVIGWLVELSKLLKNMEGKQINLPIDIDWLLRCLKKEY